MNTQAKTEKDPKLLNEILTLKGETNKNEELTLELNVKRNSSEELSSLRGLIATSTGKPVSILQTLHLNKQENPSRLEVNNWGSASFDKQ